MYLTRMINGMLVGIITYILVYPFFFHNKTLWRKIITGLIFIYGGALAFLTMIYNPPKYWDITLQGLVLAIKNIDYIPFISTITIFKNSQSINYYKDFIVLIGGNLIMLTPIALLFPLLNRDKYDIKQVTLLAFYLSLTIELLQLITNILINDIARTVEIDDLIQNVSGCVIAYFLFNKLEIINFIDKTATKLKIN